MKTLSDKRICILDHDCKIFKCKFGYPEKYLKQAVKELKDYFKKFYGKDNPWNEDLINEIFGDKLI